MPFAGRGARNIFLWNAFTCYLQGGALAKILSRDFVCHLQGGVLAQFLWNDFACHLQGGVLATFWWSDFACHLQGGVLPDFMMHYRPHSAPQGPTGPHRARRESKSSRERSKYMRAAVITIVYYCSLGC